MKTVNGLVALRRRYWGVALCAAVVLAACGGGSGGGGAPEPITPPVSGKAWQPNAQVIDQLNPPAGGAEVAINADGIGFAVRVQIDAGRLKVFASRYSAGAWGDAEAIGVADGSLGGVEGAQVAVHPNGEATAVWIQIASTGQENIVVNRYVAGQWAQPILLVSQATEVESPQIASSANGSAMVVWLQKEGNERKKTWASFFDGAEFKAAFNLDSGNGDTFAPQIAMNSKGEAVAVWEKQLAGITRIETRSFANGGWFQFTETLSDTGTDANGPQIALGDDGQAVAVWAQKTGAVFSVFASRRDAANKWVTPDLLETDDAGTVFEPQITLDALGNATAVWEQLNGPPEGLRRNVWANRLTGGNWLGAQKLETDDAGDARSPQVGSDGSGNVIAVWHQFDGTRSNVFSARFDGVQWRSPELIEQDNAGSTSSAQIAMNPAGRALAVWQQRTGSPVEPGSTENIVANVFK
jgi:hypothetical protein